MPVGHKDGCTRPCRMQRNVSSAQPTVFQLQVRCLVHLSSTSFFLPQSLWQELSSLFSFTIRLQWVPEHSFLRKNDAADELARLGALLQHSEIPCSFSLLPLISTLVFSRTGRVSHLNSSTRRFPRFPLRNLCSLVTLAVCSLSSLLQRIQLTAKLLSL